MHSVEHLTLQKDNDSGFLVLFRRESAYTWEQTNPILDDGEPGIDTTQRLLKIGDGKTPWRQLKPTTVMDIINAQMG